MLLFLKLVGSLAVAYLGVVVLMALLQDRLLFPRWVAGPGSPLPPAAERLTVSVASDEELVGVHLPAERRPRAGTRVVLGFSGNAWNATDAAIHLRATFPDREVVAFHYRGYPPSTGAPSAQAILADAVRIHDDVVRTLQPDSIVLVGISLGAGPAAHLARSRQVAGLILVTPFDTLSALARDHYPWLPVGLLLRHRMDVAGDLRAVSEPVAVISAAHDTVVPPERTEAVRLAADNLLLDRVIGGADHNDIHARPEYRHAMQEALALISSGDGAPR